MCPRSSVNQADAVPIRAGVVVNPTMSVRSGIRGLGAIRDVNQDL